MLILLGKISLFSFLCPLASVNVLLLPYFGYEEVFEELCERLWLFLLIYFILLFLFIRVAFSGLNYEVAIRGCLLGVVFSSGLLTSFLAPWSWCTFGWYSCLMSFFHFSEFVTIAATNPETLSIDSYILNHSTEYKVAAVASWVEFWLEWYFLPGLKTMWRGASVAGLVLCICGEAVRKAAMWTARSNFNHIVQAEKREGHTLVTHGVYSLCRHPSYAGWFYWAVGTQLVLVNPVCVMGYLVASWKFFHDRITVEEVTLLNFFQRDYMAYQARVPSGLPFISGYLIDQL